MYDIQLLTLYLPTVTIQQPTASSEHHASAAVTTPTSCSMLLSAASGRGAERLTNHATPNPAVLLRRTGDSSPPHSHEVPLHTRSLGQGRDRQEGHGTTRLQGHALEGRRVGAPQQHCVANFRHAKPDQVTVYRISLPMKI